MLLVVIPILSLIYSSCLWTTFLCILIVLRKVIFYLVRVKNWILERFLYIIVIWVWGISLVTSVFQTSINMELNY
jgi:hypothetical protein